MGFEPRPLQPGKKPQSRAGKPSLQIGLGQCLQGPCPPWGRTKGPRPPLRAHPPPQAWIPPTGSPDVTWMDTCWRWPGPQGSPWLWSWGPWVALAWLCALSLAGVRAEVPPAQGAPSSAVPGTGCEHSPPRACPAGSSIPGVPQPAAGSPTVLTHSPGQDVLAVCPDSVTQSRAHGQPPTDPQEPLQWPRPPTGAQGRDCPAAPPPWPPGKAPEPWCGAAVRVTHGTPGSPRVGVGVGAAAGAAGALTVHAGRLGPCGAGDLALPAGAASCLPSDRSPRWLLSRSRVTISQVPAAS